MFPVATFLPARGVINRSLHTHSITPREYRMRLITSLATLAITAVSCAAIYRFNDTKEEKKADRLNNEEYEALVARVNKLSEEFEQQWHKKSR